MLSSDADKATSAKSAASKRRIYSFTEARRIGRSYGFTTRQEFLEYECPGAYQLPKDPHVVWVNEWKGWDDFLGVPLGYESGKAVARELAERMKLETREDYLALMANRGGGKASSPPISDDDLAIRLPYRPDIYYKNGGWDSWEEWLGSKWVSRMNFEPRRRSQAPTKFCFARQVRVYLSLLMRGFEFGTVAYSKRWTCFGFQKRKIRTWSIRRRRHKNTLKKGSGESHWIVSLLCSRSKSHSRSVYAF